MPHQHDIPRAIADLLNHATEQETLLPMNADQIAQVESQEFLVDLETGQVQPDPASPNDWQAFTECWMEYCGYAGLNPSYCRLAIAICKADGQRYDWAHYIDLARNCTAHYHELHDQRLINQKAALETAGWVFEYIEGKWIATVPSTECQGQNLREVLDNIHKYALPRLAEWTEKWGPKFTGHVPAPAAA